MIEVNSPNPAKSRLLRVRQNSPRSGRSTSGQMALED